MESNWSWIPSMFEILCYIVPISFLQTRVIIAIPIANVTYTNYTLGENGWQRRDSRTINILEILDDNCYVNVEWL